MHAHHRPAPFAPALLPLLASLLLVAAPSPASAAAVNTTFLESLASLLNDATNGLPATTNSTGAVTSAYLQAIASEWMGVRD